MQVRRKKRKRKKSQNGRWVNVDEMTIESTTNT